MVALDQPELLAAIVNRPDAMEVRLIYADWLDENGQPERAELSRLWVERQLAAWPAWAAEHQFYDDRVAKLHAQAADRWFSQVSRSVGLPVQPSDLILQGFSGCVDSLQASESRFIQVGSLLLHRHPIDSLTLQELRPRTTAFTGANPALSGIRHLHLHRQALTLDHAQALARTDQLTSLQTLDLSEAELPAEWVGVVCSAPALSGLRRLRLDSVRSSSRLIPALLERPLAGPLAELSLVGVASDVEAISELSTSRYLQDLETLDLSYNFFGLDGAMLLAESPYLRFLAHLRLDSCQLRHRGLSLLANTFYLTHLHSLSLARNHLNDQCLAALAGWSLSKLQHLDLSINRISRLGLAQLLHSPNFSNLESLDLTGNSLSGEHLRAFVQATRPAHLLQLNLSNNGLDDELGMSQLAQAECLASLRNLLLRRTTLTDRGLARLLDSPLASSLQLLDVSDNHLSDSGAELLLAPQLNLRYVNVRGNKLGARIIERLRQRFGWRLMA